MFCRPEGGHGKPPLGTTYDVPLHRTSVCCADANIRHLKPKPHSIVPVRCPGAVIATIGPATQSVDVLCKMLEAGMTCARLDLTVGSSS